LARFGSSCGQFTDNSRTNFGPQTACWFAGRRGASLWPQILTSKRVENGTSDTADLVLGKRNWQITAGGLLVFSLIMASSIVCLISRSRYIPYVVEVDKLGYALTASEPSVTPPPPTGAQLLAQQPAEVQTAIKEHEQHGKWLVYRTAEYTLYPYNQEPEPTVDCAPLRTTDIQL
jgi:VirB8 protein